MIKSYKWIWCHLVLFGTLSEHGKYTFPQHVHLVYLKSIQFLGQLALPDESPFQHLPWILCKDHIHVCLSWAGFCNIFTEWDGRLHKCSDAGQDFLAWDHGITSVHLGKAHFIKIHPHSTMLILLLINMEQEISCLQPQLHIFASWLNEQQAKR